MQILFVELLGGLGDVLIALAAIQALARSHPTATLTVLTFVPGGELLEFDPQVHRVVYTQKGNARSAVESLLATQPFDVIVSDTTYDGIDEMIRSSGAAKVVTNLWRSPPENEFVSDRFLKILLQEGLIQPEAIAPAKLHLTQAEQHWAEATLADAARPIIVLYPDAGMAIKRWSAANFITLGRTLQQRVGGTIVIPVGADAEEATQIATAIGQNTCVWQRGTLRQFASLVAQADLFIAPDTGPARIAAALEVPTVTLFGPSWHGRYGQAQPHENLQGYPECPERVVQNFTVQTCWYEGNCPIADWQTCLEAIAPAEVLAVAERLLSRNSPENQRTDTKPDSKTAPTPLPENSYAIAHPQPDPTFHPLAKHS